METISDKRIREMHGLGYKLVGQTTGTPSFRKGSNLAQKLEDLGLTKDDVIVKMGARAGQFKNDGYELLIFKKE